jgi:TolB-like protein
MGEVSFGRFRLDLKKRELSLDGAPIELGSRGLDILSILASEKGGVVSKDDLMSRVWPSVVVEENNIQVHIHKLRKALEEGDANQSYVVTVPGRGYRLVGLREDTLGKASVDADQGPDGFVRDKPSIAVLPFQNLSGDPEQEYFADGIVDDIITGLSRIKWLLVIARNSSFVYKGNAVDVIRVGRELSARYLVEGSVRKAGDRIRINAQLIDARTSIHLWAETYDRLLTDIFSVQDELAMSVIGAIEPSLRAAEIQRVKRKRPDNLDAYDLVLRSLPFTRDMMVDGAIAAVPLLQSALKLEPDYALAHAVLARCFHIRFSRGGFREEDRAASIYHARCAIIAGTDDASALAIAALVIWFDDHDIITALDLFDRALAISNSNVTALSNSALAMAWMGKSDIATERAQRALRLSPFDTHNSYMALAVAYFHVKRFREAREAALRAVNSNPGFSVPRALLAATLVRLNEIDQAKVVLQRVLELQPSFSIKGFSITNGQAPNVYNPFANAWYEAGMPLE